MQEYTADIHDERLDVFIARMVPEMSRSFLQKVCERGDVTVNGAPGKIKAKLRVGDLVQVTLPEPIVHVGELPILYEDDDVIVMNKPAGILTHAKGLQSEEFTVADFVRPRTTDGVDGNRPGIVHRLDRETSGVIIAAKNYEAKCWLQKQFSERKVKKSYIALVVGKPGEDEALLQLPIERNPKKPQTFRVGANGKPAETAYHVVKHYKNYSLVSLQPKTGRTHQLRVHMYFLKCPIVGDVFYGTAKPSLGRMFLHAETLELTLPSRQRKVFKAPLAPELEEYLTTLE